MEIGITRPRLIALDTAQLGNWARDRASRSTQRQAAARQFEENLQQHGLIVLLCWHHFAELFATESDADAQACAALISSLPLVAWVKSLRGDDGFGSIVDILGQELRANLETPQSTLEQVQRATAKRLFCFSSGAEAFAPYAEIWREVQPYLREEAQQLRANLAITRANAIDNSASKISDLLAGKVRHHDDASDQMARMQLALQREVTLRGDKRIKAPEAVARAFVESVAATVRSLIHDPETMPTKLVDMYGVPADQIGPDATLADVNVLSIFRHQLKVAAEAAGLAPNDQRLDRLRMDQFPSQVIKKTMNAHRQDLPERRGSEVTDIHLMCLAPYADAVFVDRRTFENLRRALPHASLLATLTRSVRRTSFYHRTIGELG